MEESHCRNKIIKIPVQASDLRTARRCLTGHADHSDPNNDPIAHPRSEPLSGHLARQLELSLPALTESETDDPFF